MRLLDLSKTMRQRLFIRGYVFAISRDQSLLTHSSKADLLIT